MVPVTTEVAEIMLSAGYFHMVTIAMDLRTNAGKMQKAIPSLQQRAARHLQIMAHANVPAVVDLLDAVAAMSIRKLRTF